MLQIHPINVSMPVVHPAGWLPDPVDYMGADRPLARTPMAVGAMGVIEDEMDLSDYFLDVSDQMTFPSCTANATADAWEATSVLCKVQEGMSLEQAKSEVPDLSRMFAWWCGRNEMAPSQAKNPASGCYIRLMMDVVSRFGLPPEELWPYDDAPIGPCGEVRSVVQPSQKAFRAAIVNTSSASYCIKETGDDRHKLLLQALGAKHPPVFGTSLVSAFRTYSGGVIPEPASDSQFIGQHAMVVVGWSTRLQAYKVRNSWRPTWGEHGYCWLSKGYVLSKVTGSIWVATKGLL